MFSHVTFQGMLLGEGLTTDCTFYSQFLVCRGAGGDAVLGAWVQEESSLNLQKVHGYCKGRGGAGGDAVLGAWVQEESSLNLQYVVLAGHRGR